MTEHRVSMLGSTLRRYADPANSRDPRVMTLLDHLKHVQVAPEPRPHFRAELRAQLVAVAPRIVAEGLADGAAKADVPSRPLPAHRDSAAPAADPAADGSTGASRWTKLRAIPIGRPLAVAASIVMVFALLLGGAVWMSRSALPGDSLYGLKRASEQWQLMTDSGNQQLAQDHLDFAATRVEEAAKLLSRPSAAGTGPQADGAISEHTGTLIATALSDADSDTRAASRLLGAAALQSASGAPLSPMINWVPQQLNRLDDLAAAMPGGSLRTRATSSTSLVHAVAARVTTLETKVACACMGDAPSDSLGPVPCAQCTTPATPAAPKPAPAGTSAPSTPSVAAPPASTQPTHPIVVPPQPGPTGSGSPSPPAQSSTPQKPILPLPSLPLPTLKPSLPVTSVGSCEIKLLGLTLPLCTSSTP
ncbi:MAG: DUF5667 domain-containing protein [Jatrophihabitans sp.]